MSAMTIKELCEQAKKHRVGHDTEMCDALVDMHARLSPDVVLSVVEALELAHKRLFDAHSTHAANKCRDALEILNRPKP